MPPMVAFELLQYPKISEAERQKFEKSIDQSAAPEWDTLAARVAAELRRLVSKRLQVKGERVKNLPDYTLDLITLSYCLRRPFIKTLVYRDSFFKKIEPIIAESELVKTHNMILDLRNFDDEDLYQNYNPPLPGQDF